MRRGRRGVRRSTQATPSAKLRHMKLRIPPLLLSLITGALIWGAAKYFTQFGVTFPGQKPVGFLLIAFGVLVAVVAIAAFARSKTTVNPMKPDAASNLVTTGLYRFSRNPMYLSMLGVLLGWSVVVGNLAALAMPAGFVWYMTVFQIKPEEAALTKIFGDEYRDYCKRVRRWI